ncbi:FecR family protein [Lutibacter sp. HS1-25]|nr:FecR family protein [Lutibacter sp. HS1-25]
MKDWLKDESNKNLYNEILSSTSVYNKRALYEQSNKEKVFKIVKDKIDNNQKRATIKQRYLSLFKYAASILVLLTLGNLIYKAKFDANAITQEAVKNINPGHEKAILVLSDGTVVDLEQHKNEMIISSDIAQAKNAEEALVYNVVDSETSDDNVVQPLKYNTLKVPNGGMYQVVLSDGTKVWLNSATSLTYPEKFGKGQRIVQLEGEAYFEVTKDVKEFIVKTNVADVTVLGTQFNVSSYKDDSFFSSTLVEGKIKLATSSNSGINNTIILAPNQRGVINKNASKIQVNTVDTEVYTAWRDGKFYFEKEHLEDILTRMARWYNIDVVFDDESLKTEMFTGVFYKNNKIDHLLDMISKTTKVNYVISKNKINDKYELKLTRD